MFDSVEDMPVASGAAPNAAVGGLMLSRVVRAVVLVGMFGYVRVVNYPSSLVVLCALAIAAALLAAIQRPWAGSRRISPACYVRVGAHGAVYALEVLMFVAALKYLGPIRAILLSDFSSLSMTSLAALCFAPNRRSLSSQRKLGAGLLLAGYLLLVLFDLPYITSGPRILNRYLGPISPSMFGLACLILSNLAGVARVQMSRKLTTEVGGAKRLHALSVAASFVVLTPVALIHYAWVVNEVMAGFGMLHFWEVMAACGVLAFACDFYAVTMARARAGAGAVAAGGVLASTAGCVLAAAFASTPVPAAPSALSVLSALLIASGFYLQLSKGEGMQSVLSSGILGPAALVSGGAASSGAPQGTYSSAVFYEFLSSLVHRIRVDPDARHIFYYLVINFSFMFMELGYGLWNNSLGLVSDACHMLFDCIALLIGLSGLVIAEWRPNRVFTFGYKRVNVLSAFINAVFLVFIAVSVVFEAVQRFFEPVHVHHDRLLLVSVLGFLVNLVGLFVFHQAHETAHGHSHSGGGHAHGESHSHAHGHSHGGSSAASLGELESGKHSHGHDEALSGTLRTFVACGTTLVAPPLYLACPLLLWHSSCLFCWRHNNCPHCRSLLAHSWRHARQRRSHRFVFFHRVFWLDDC
eukprot:TRINITY_DN1783_c0_g1_i5.p1 TRINITY_DN1783_c0_g1~~TRINITY_DN1783_c0_g1_i5.p1  ORF type:complete len:680 (+),score=147.25 TRINITY_DN1783_c0_g1_i5:128-2041(+)